MQLQRLAASRPVNQPVFVRSKRSGTISEYLAVSLSIRQDSNLQTVSLSACPSNLILSLSCVWQYCCCETSPRTKYERHKRVERCVLNACDAYCELHNNNRPTSF